MSATKFLSAFLSKSYLSWSTRLRRFSNSSERLSSVILDWRDLRESSSFWILDEFSAILFRMLESWKDFRTFERVSTSFLRMSWSAWGVLLLSLIGYYPSERSSLTIFIFVFKST